MKRLLFVLLLFFSANSFAVDYYWRLAPAGSLVSGSSNKQYISATAACDAVPALWIGGAWTATGVVISLTRNSDIKFSCIIQIKNSSGTLASSSAFAIDRYGDSCPSGTVFDPVAGQCKSPCADKNATSRPFSKSGTAGDNYMTLTSGPKPVAIASQVGCFDGCMASTADQKCTTKTTGAYFCRGTAWFDGQSCAATGTPGVDSSSSSAYPDSQQTTDTKPCNYTTNADGTQSCTSSTGTEKEGQICGTVSATGAKICVDKPPSKQGLDITTNVKTETDANGNKTTTKTDTATTTKCSDIKSCTSTSTTVTTVTKTDGNGKTTSVTGSCTGANCPDKNTNPDGNGDGFGDCASGDCGDGEGEGGAPGVPEFDDVDDYQVTTQKFQDRLYGSPIGSAVSNLSFPEGGGSPPVLVSDPIAFLDGAVLDLSVIQQLKPYVEGMLSGLFKAVWCVVALVIFLMA